MGVYGYNLSNLNERMVLSMENTMENKFSNPQDTIPFPWIEVSKASGWEEGDFIKIS